MPVRHPQISDMNTLYRRLLWLLLPLAVAGPAPQLRAQRPSFADGYHGGIYGHYPLWCTRFFVEQLAEHPEWRINLEIEPETWDSVRLHTPADYAAFVAAAADPRVEFVNPAYGQPYCFNIHGESLVRHFEYGIAKLREHFPDARLTCYSSEEPCFTDCLPAVLRGFGYTHAVLKCPDTCWGGYMRGHGRGVVSWVGPSGDTIAALPRYECEALVEGSTWQTAAWNNSDDYLEACRRAGVRFPAGMCFQDAGWRNGPWIGTGAATAGGSRYVTWSEYFERVWDGRTDGSWMVTQEDILVNLMWGSQVLQRVARQVRAAENRAVQAEKADLVRWLGGGASADSARMAAMWRPLMLAQHHDCWIVPYNIVLDGMSWADMVGRWCGATQEAADSLIGTGVVSHEFDVVNTSGRPRRGVVRVAVPDGMAEGPLRVVDGHGRSVHGWRVERDGVATCLFEADVPAFGVARYRLERDGGRRRDGGPCAAYAAPEGFVVESDIYRMVIDTARGGAVTSLVDRRTGREVVDRGSEWGFNTLRGYFYDEGRFFSSVESPARVEVEYQTPVEVRVAVECSIAGEPVRQTLTLRRGDEVIDCALRIAWRGNRGIGEYADSGEATENRRAFKDDRYKLLLMFPTATGRATLHKNAPFSLCRSRLDDTFFKTWDGHKHNVVVDWVDVTGDGGGLALMSDHTTSYAYGGDMPLALTVQYSGKGLWGRDYPIEGATELTYALMPHCGEWDAAAVWNACCDRNEPLAVRPAEESRTVGRSLVDVGGVCELSSARRRGGDVELRLFNPTSEAVESRVSLGFGVSRALLTRLDGEAERELATMRRRGRTSVTVTVPPSGFATLRLTPQ